MLLRLRGVRRLSVVLAALVLCGAPVLAHAQTTQPAKGWTVIVGVGPYFSPDFEGSSGYHTIPFPYAEIDYNDRLSISTLDGVHYDAIKWKDLSIGPSAQFKLPRNQRDNAALRGLGRVGAAVEVGGYVDYNPRAFDISLEVRHDVLGGHNGTIAELDAHVQAKLFKDVGIEFGPNLTWVDGNYMQSYFGVDKKQAAHSIYHQYKPGAGFKDVGLFFGTQLQFSRHWMLIAEGTYSYLLDGAARSPLVKNGGDRNQIELGVFLAYQF